MKSTILATLIVAALVLGSGCAPKKPAAQAATPESAPKAIRASVAFFEGDVKIDGVAAELGRELGPKVEIVTGPDSSCDLVFDERNAIRIGQKASATLDFSGIVKQVELRKGGVTSVLRKLGKIAGADSFRIVTGSAVAGVRGTSFCVWADEGSTYLCACNGSVHTIDSSGANELALSASHHTARIYSKKGSATLVASAGIEHHSDASVESLAARIGEKIDWTKQD